MAALMPSPKIRTALIFNGLPPTGIAVGQEFQIELTALSDATNSSIGLVSLIDAEPQASGLPRASAYLQGTVAANWKVTGADRQTMEFRPLKVTYPGRYRLQVHFYNEPKVTEDGKGAEMEKTAIAESEIFVVHQTVSS
ncbi:hypothetical protein F5Y05DRAFT_122213 [Hypoxylon sp. FL0543]|nr:hypothetical protein F5Y05DRAFT_122213 [Hypoxylon sp. FL0543]